MKSHELLGYRLTLMYALMTVAFAFRHPPLMARQMLARTYRCISVFPMRRLFMTTEASPRRTLAKGSHQAEMDVKKSRFICYASHAETWNEAKVYIQSIKEEHPKARHWCFGFRGGGDESSIEERCSDDGEPTGTAGLPILSAIKGEGLSDTVCVVVRYFGGIKLGAGGLIRAYGAAARAVLREAPVDLLIRKSILKVRVSTEHIGALYEVATRLGASLSNEHYDADGSLSASLTFKTTVLQQLLTALNDSTKGTLRFES